MTKADGAKSLAARLAQKAGLKHAGSDQSAQSKDTKGTKMTRSNSDMPVSTNRCHERSTDGFSDTEHANITILETSANYWPANVLLPESGKLRVDEFSIIFKGVTGTTLTFNYTDIKIDKASRLGGMIHDAIKVTINKDGNIKQEEYLFTTILKDRTFVFDKIQDAMAEAHVKRKTVGKAKEPPFQMPPDEILERMSIIGKEKLKGVSMQDYYEVAWSEGQNSKKPAIYGPFLASFGKNNVVVSPWEEGRFQGAWCEQNYTHQRLITFNFMKQTIGQTLVEVKHTQRLIRDKDDRCIVHISMEMKGFPYADCFVVEVRHVASRIGKQDLIVQVGMYVRFVKGCLFEGKIRNNTGTETSNAHGELLKRICEGCKEYAVEVVTEEEDQSDGLTDESIASPSNGEVAPTNRSTKVIEANSAVQTILLLLATLFRKYVLPYLPYEYKYIQPNTVDEALKDVRQRITVLRELSMKSFKEEEQQEVKNEILAIEKSLTRIEQMNVSAELDD